MKEKEYQYVKLDGLVDSLENKHRKAREVRSLIKICEDRELVSDVEVKLRDESNIISFRIESEHPVHEMKVLSDIGSGSEIKYGNSGKYILDAWVRLQ